MDALPLFKSMEGQAPYAALWVKSNYSFLEGASHPEELVEQAYLFGLKAIAITDRDGVYGIVRAHLKAKELGVHLIIGSEMTVQVDEEDRHVVLLAKNRAGYSNLCQLISRGRLRSNKGECRVTLDEVSGSAGDLVALCPDPSLLKELEPSFEKDLFAVVTRHNRAEDIPREQKVRATAHIHNIPVVAAVETLYHDRSRRPLSDVVSCIRHGCSLTTAGSRIKPNDDNALLSIDDMRHLFKDDPDAVDLTETIANRCSFSLDQIRYRYPGEQLPDGQSEMSWLRKLTYEGAAQRYDSEIPSDVTAQLERELSVIDDLEYGGYFLTMWEVVRFCREQDIICQGRGSAANSAVCYCLGITAVDPVRMELLFERFLSRERAEPPDIDVDIEHERREEVIQHVYEKYGRRYAAMVANVIRYRTKSAVREVGKVLGIPQTDIDGVARLLGHYSSSLDKDSLESAGLNTESPATMHLLRLVSELIDFPRHLSIHPGGFLLGHEAVDTLVPIEPATMENRTVIQWDKQDIEDLGLFKIDLLGLGSLTAVHRSFDLIEDHYGTPLDMAGVPAEDPATYKMIQAGDTIGVFQIESRAQMSMLPRLKPKTFYDLVIEVAIVRPGPIQGDMVHPYLRRRDGTEPVTYPHPSLEKVLHKTLGIPIFQEQVMKLAVVAADYTPGEADQLRRDMAAWRSKGRIEAHRDRLLSRMVNKGIPQEFAERVFSQIQGFGEYGFPESHAASFALIAYVTAWLRCHYPAAFLCAMLNAQPMGFYSPSSLIEDAKRHDVPVHPIDVNRSVWDCSLEEQNGVVGVRMGLRYVMTLGSRERERFDAIKGPFESIEHFVRSMRWAQPKFVAVAESGGFDSFGLSRRDAIWQVRGLSSHAKDPLPLSPAPRTIAFQGLHPMEEVAWDYRSSQHSPRGHPMESIREQLRSRSVPTASRVNEMRDGNKIDYVGMVICRQRPGTATGVTFFTLEDETGLVNAVVWRQTFEKYAFIGKTASLLGIRGKLQVANNVTHLIAEELYLPRLEFESEAELRSRDFH